MFDYSLLTRCLHVHSLIDVLVLVLLVSIRTQLHVSTVACNAAYMIV